MTSIASPKARRDDATGPILAGMGAPTVDVERPPTAGRGIAETVSGARHLFEGEIVAVEPRTEAGFARGVITLAGLDADRGRRIRIDFQTGYPIARPEGGGEPLRTLPDLLVLVERESGRALGSEVVRYGLHLSVLGLPAP